MLLSAVALTVVTPPGLFLSLQWRGWALGVLYFGVQATAEEAAKAIGIGVTKLRRNRLNWFWITALIAGAVGTLERLLWLMNATPEARDRLSDAFGREGLFVADAAMGHTALSLLCVMAARIIGRGWFGWVVGVTGAGMVHMLHNLLPLRIDVGGALVWPALTGALSLVIIGSAFALRKRLDWRG
jgi:hypothetical protein